MQRHRSVRGTGSGNLIYLGLTVFVVGVVLLGNVNACGSQEFCKVTVFGMLFGLSAIMILLFGVFTGGGMSTIGGAGPLGRFMFQSVTYGKLLWIPIGVVAVVAVSYSVTFWDFEYAPFVGIFFSGIIMFMAFLQTNSLLIPIVIHGVYNSIVVFLREGGTGVFDGFTPSVGTAGLDLAQQTKFWFEVALQNTLVAPSEELFKLFTIALFIAILRGSYQNGGMRMYFAGGIAVFIWTILHLIQGS